MSSLAMDFTWCNNRTVLGFYNFSGCYYCLHNFFFLVSELYIVFPTPKDFERSKKPNSDQKMDVIIMSCVLSAFALLLLVLFAVAQVFLSEF